MTQTPTIEPDANAVLLDLLEHARELTPEDRAQAIESLSGFVGGLVVFGNAAPLGLLLGCIELLNATAEGDHHD